MDLNPKSPFSDRTLNDLTGEHVREGDAWCAQLLGWWSITPNIDSDDWTGCHPANTVDQSIRNYHSDWAAAGPLMEREEWPSYWILSKDSLANKQGYSVLDMIDDSWDLITFQESPTAAIRNAFIIAASHAAQREGWVG